MDLGHLEIRNWYSLDLESLTKDERGFWQALPEDYRACLKRHNGGFVAPGKAHFRTHIERLVRGRVHSNSNSALTELWGFLSHTNSKPVEGMPASLLHEHFDRHLDDEFLPDGVIVIGRCVQHSLVCMSLNRADFGSIYYWEWYWRYPWYKDFFLKRIKAARSLYPGIDAILADPQHPQYREAADAINYATLVLIADSFTGFINNLHAEGEGEERGASVIPKPPKL